MRRSKNRLTDGFTLLEVLLTVALLAGLASLSLPLVPRWQQLNDADIAANTIAQSLRRAQALAQSGQGDSTWGVSIDASDNNQIVLFRGATYAARDVGYDEVYDLSSTFAVSGVQEVVFASVTGIAGTVGTITLTTRTQQTRNVTINAKGTVGY